MENMKGFAEKFQQYRIDETYLKTVPEIKNYKDAAINLSYFCFYKLRTFQKEKTYIRKTMTLQKEKYREIYVNAYKGTIYSSFFKSGAEVKQAFNYYENKWEVTSEHWNAST
jgi:hypothetical protein